MGEVYLAEDTRLGRKIALKLLAQELTKNRDRLNRFDQEAYAASALNHPNILTIYEMGDEGGRHFIATEFVDGQTLAYSPVGRPDGNGGSAERGNSNCRALWKRRMPPPSFIGTSNQRNVMIRRNGHV